MGQKVHPIGIRLGIVKKHTSVWYAEGEEYANNLLTICASNDFKINILYSAMFKSRTKNDNLFCYINKNKYENLFNKKEIRIFNSWNIPSNLSSFWK